MCWKKAKKTKSQPKPTSKIANITNKQIAQYIVVDIEKLEKNEDLKDNSSSFLATKTKHDFYDDKPIERIEKKPVDEGEIQKFTYNFMEAPPPHFDRVNVLNEENLLRTDEIKLENI